IAEGAEGGPRAFAARQPPPTARRAQAAAAATDGAGDREAICARARPAPACQKEANR
ncbi:unnamed protein product, partial [Prorocentrum cordatum]